MQPLEASKQKLDLVKYMNAQMGSGSINSAQNNASLQATWQYRGLPPRPSLALPQGLSDSNQNGVRINEPLGECG